MSDLHPLDHPGILGCDLTKWTPLCRDVCMFVARGQLDAFVCAADYVAGLVRQCLVTKQDAADTLQQAAIYNSLPFYYGADCIQRIMADAFTETEATA